MAYAFIHVAKRPRVTTIMFNRPEAMNAINPAMHHELQHAFDGFTADPEQCVCVLTGAGDRAFCAGSDLKATANGDIPTYPANGYGGFAERFDLFKPVIAAVNGVCLGGGFELALACDIVIAAEEARFGLTEPRVGALAIAGGIHRLARDIGLKRAMGHLLTCDHIPAREGLALGFVNEVVPRDALDACVERWCERILANAPMAIRATKEIAHRGLGESDVAAAMRNQPDYPGFKAWLASDDLVEGPTAFAQKRPPVWRNR
jgi:enoyl-CoA hydratase/carnithine racemase